MDTCDAGEPGISALRRITAGPDLRKNFRLGRFDRFGKSSANDRYLRSPDGWS
jgi:hypothetical protein